MLYKTMTHRAILSVYDKSGLLPLARALLDHDWELVASGGTARALRSAGLPVTPVSEITGAPEMLGGRVKTLHPAVHAAILARDDDADLAELAANGITPIDLVVCNLYPFNQTVSRPGVTMVEAVEQIDIGGVTLLRAAAKNFARVTVLCDPADYQPTVDEFLAHGGLSLHTCQRLAFKAFAHTRDYDTAISAYLSSFDAADVDHLPSTLPLALTRVQTLRYGENPHQAAALYAQDPAAGPLGGRLLQGKALSYNNLLDLDAAWRAAAAFKQPAIVIVKHLSPCGIAVHPRTPAQAFPAALASDPLSAFGGVIAANRALDETFAAVLEEANLFVEAIVAPAFSPQALQWFAQHKKNCRLLALSDVDLAAELAALRLELRAIRDGFLAQTADAGDPEGTQWRVVTERQPDAAQWEALRFAWTAVTHVKSNAIVLARENATVGIGGGLPSRVDAVRLAVAKAAVNAQGAVLASDAFFPFPDAIEVAAQAGVSAVIQSGGSIRDQAVIAAADKLGLAMVFTGVRHFRH